VERGRHALGEGVEHALLLGGVGPAVGSGAHRDRSARHAVVVEEAHAAAGAEHRAPGGFPGGDPDGVADALDDHDGRRRAEQRDGMVGQLASGLLGALGGGQDQLGLAQPVHLVDLEPALRLEPPRHGPRRGGRDGHQREEPGFEDAERKGQDAEAAHGREQWH
jgi:hypothetical protein